MKLKNIVTFLDRELAIADFEDHSNNGLQVGNAGQVRKVCCGVDASMGFFKEAEKRGADLAIVHHGLSWGDSLKFLTGRNYRLVSCLIDNNMALYACHLPLDAHPRYGNNIRIARELGLRSIKPFGQYGGQTIGFCGRLPKPMRYDAFKRRLAGKTQDTLQSMDFGKKTVQTVAVVSGGGTDCLPEAAEKGVDVFVTGEPKLSAWHVAQEYGINAVYAGHYATEVFGVKAVGELLKKQFKVKVEFIDLKIPF